MGGPNPSGQLVLAICMHFGQQRKVTRPFMQQRSLSMSLLAPDKSLCCSSVYVALYCIVAEWTAVCPWFDVPSTLPGAVNFWVALHGAGSEMEHVQCLTCHWPSSDGSRAFYCWQNVTRLARGCDH